MLKRAMALVTTAIALVLVGIGAAAQNSANDADDTHWIDAKLIDIDVAARTITVRFDENNAIRTFPVSEDANIVRTDDRLERPIEMSDMHIGAELKLEFDGLKGEETLRKIMNHTSSESSESSAG